MGNDYLTFEEIEKRVGFIISDAIRMQCIDKDVWKGSEFVKEEEVEHGRKLTFRNIYEDVFKEKEYRETLLNYYNQHVHKEYEAKEEKDEGKNIKVDEFLETVFRNSFDNRRGQKDKQGRTIYRKAHLFKIDSEKNELIKSTSVSTLDQLKNKVKNERYNHFSPQLYIHGACYSKEFLSILNVIVLDFDLVQQGIYMSTRQLRRYIEKKLKVTPNIIHDTHTKGNYQAVISIEPMMGTPKSVHLYEEIVREMILTLEIADYNARNANHSFSIGVDSSRKQRRIRKYHDRLHNINQFRWLLKQRDDRRKKEGVLIDFTEKAFMKHPAIEALMNGEVEYRNNAAFTLALVLKHLKWSEDETKNFMHGDWLHKVNQNHKYDHPFTRNELDHCVKHAYSGKYKNFHSTHVTRCTGIPCDFEGYFRRKRFTPYENKGAYDTKAKQRLMQFFADRNGIWEGNRKDLAIELDANEETLKKMLPKLRNEGEIEYETVRGAGATTTFKVPKFMQQVIEEPVIKGIALKTFAEEEEEIDDIFNSEVAKYLQSKIQEAV